jgi:hypothetical protein
MPDSIIGKAMIDSPLKFRQHGWFFGRKRRRQQRGIPNSPIAQAKGSNN